MTITRCRACDAIRPPNARFCSACGTGFDSGLAAPTLPSREVALGMSLWTAIKIGFGLALGTSLLGLIAWVFIGFTVAVGLGLGPRP